MSGEQQPDAVIRSVASEASVASVAEGDEAEAAPQPARRPLSIILGSLLMLARAIAGFVFVAASASTLAGIVSSIVNEILNEQPEDRLSPVEAASLTEALSGLLVAALIAYLIWHTIYFFLMVAVFRGSNVARIVAMSFATVSILFAFLATVSGGEQISFRTSLLSLALDILILLALSGHDARAYARRDRAPKPLRSRRRVPRITEARPTP